MNGKAIVHFHEFDVSWSELRTLPDEHLAAVAVLSYAVSETNALMRTYLSQNYTYVEDKAINSAINISRFLLIRSWSSRLFEIEQFLQFGGKKPKTDDPMLLNLSKEALHDFETLVSIEGYEVARDIRNEATNHYSFSAAMKNLSNVRKDADCKMYAHEMSGNCFYPFGEEVMFHARLNRRWKNISDQEARNKLFYNWLEWNISANRWLEKTHAEFSNALVVLAFQRKPFRKRSYWIPQNLLGKHEENIAPLFIKKGYE